MSSSEETCSLLSLLVSVDYSREASVLFMPNLMSLQGEY